MTGTRSTRAAVLAAVLALAACSSARSQRTFQDSQMDFGAIRTVAVLPFANLSRESTGAERVREVFSNMLLATGAVYVLPPGEVMRGVSRVQIADPRQPSVEEITKLGTLLKADAVIRGVVQEYGEVRSASAAANVVSVSVEMYENSPGRIVWSGASTKGGIGMSDRLLGSGGAPMNEVTERAIDDLLGKLFK
jgi:polysaccharide biosynthesis protein PelC